MNIVLNLSASAPHEWASCFNSCWRSHRYMRKRRATISGKRLEIFCVPDELEKDHLPELKKIIAETNQIYRKFLEANQQAEAARNAKVAAEQEKLANMKKSIKFVTLIDKWRGFVNAIYRSKSHKFE